jgi:hypothetical protein
LFLEPEGVEMKKLPLSIAAIALAFATQAAAQNSMPQRRMTLDQANVAMANEDSIQRTEREDRYDTCRRRSSNMAEMDRCMRSNPQPQRQFRPERRSEPQQPAQCEQSSVHTDDRVQTQNDTVHTRRSDNDGHIRISTVGTGNNPIGIIRVDVGAGTRGAGQRTTRNGTRTDSRTRTSCENGYRQ